jgi:SnoaL-like polyketide cyclase
MLAAVPDSRLEVRRSVAVGDLAAVEWTLRGTFSGAAFQGIRATGKPVVLDGVDVVEVRDGLQYRNTIYYDGATFARQIGLLPRLGSAADRATLAAFNAKTRLLRARR